MPEQNPSLTLAGRLHLCPCCAWPPVDVSYCSDASGAGKACGREERLPSGADVLCRGVFSLLLRGWCALPRGLPSAPPGAMCSAKRSSLRSSVSAAWQPCVVPPLSYLLGNRAPSGCWHLSPVLPGQAPFSAGKVIFSSYFLSEHACCLSLDLCW